MVIKKFVQFQQFFCPKKMNLQLSSLEIVFPSIYVSVWSIFI